jgi:hypothetical protein
LQARFTKIEKANMSDPIAAPSAEKTADKEVKVRCHVVLLKVLL